MKCAFITLILGRLPVACSCRGEKLIGWSPSCRRRRHALTQWSGGLHNSACQLAGGSLLQLPPLHFVLLSSRGSQVPGGVSLSSPGIQRNLPDGKTVTSAPCIDQPVCHRYHQAAGLHPVTIETGHGDRNLEPRWRLKGDAMGWISR